MFVAPIDAGIRPVRPIEAQQLFRLGELIIPESPRIRFAMHGAPRHGFDYSGFVNSKSQIPPYVDESFPRKLAGTAFWVC